ncbi:HelD family protein [Helcobacillus massiliensis]|uniref:HelD family protein n=1 Tax=Helcobacillus massiliensis TaxID=521392 RepID=UPI0029530EDE|nr:UvrD-helicase domain-containing protein [Helcobacillus massiliensis]WOO93343.1 AAA family ATPase [Helcobacillus massiliensis]
MGRTSTQLELEQAAVDTMYRRIDELIEHLTDQMERTAGSQSASTHQNRSERDAFTAFYEDRISLLRTVSHSAVFGRLDMVDGARRYIGRIGLFTANRDQLLMDWRAPAAAAFYQATAHTPQGVRLRRHLITNGRTVTGVDDDVLDRDLLHEASDDSSDLQGEGALLAAVSASRTGRMGDIVATIQGEQDRIIRSENRGVLVVQGGPGTGKTAVALHRAAYQLYTHRARLEQAGVLIVAPTRGFLTYIERVLPSLGESGAVMATPGELFPGVTATETDQARIAEIKGRPVMANLLKRALRHRQLVPAADIHLRIDGVPLTITPADIKAARSEARSSGRPHNRARTTFVRAALDRLVDRYADEIRRQGRTITEEDHPDLINDLRTDDGVKVALNRAWLPYTPESFLRSFFASEQRVRRAAHGLMPMKDAAALVRSKDSAWTIDDVPLLDEIAELLGEDDAAARQEEKRQKAAQQDQIGYAEKVLEMMDSDGMISAQDLAAQVSHMHTRRTVAERAAGDRTWTYGHVVVDEAQELSAMMWRLLMRRNPTKSFTVVGDVAQTSSPAGTTSWTAVLEPFVEDRAQIEELTVNYRTPARIMAAANRVARAHDLLATEVQSVREGEHNMHLALLPGQAGSVGEGAPSAEQMDAIAAEVRRVRALIGDGRLAVVAPDAAVAPLVEALGAQFDPGEVGAGSAGIDSPVSVMNARDSKGLEFDAVVLTDPATICEAHARGANDVFVAMTRPTQVLSVLHHGNLPDGFEDPSA